MSCVAIFGHDAVLRFVRMKIAVLFGGTSEERDVSIASAAQVIPVLRGLGHEVIAVDTAAGRLAAPDERKLLDSRVAPLPPSDQSMATLRGGALTNPATAIDPREIELVFLALHGGAGEDGRIQAMLDLAGLRYTGSNHIASAAAMDKDLSKRLFRAAGVPTADWLMAPVSAEEVGRVLGFPVVVKPNKQGSTVGLSVVREPGKLAAALELGHRYDDEVMIERFVPGREFTVGILEAPRCRWARSSRPARCSTTSPSTRWEGRARFSRRTFRQPRPRRCKSTRWPPIAALKLGAYSRVDFRRDGNGNFWCLEANSLPGMTATSLLPQAARAAGMDFQPCWPESAPGPWAGSIYKSRVFDISRIAPPGTRLPRGRGRCIYCAPFRRVPGNSGHQAIDFQRNRARLGEPSSSPKTTRASRRKFLLPRFSSVPSFDLATSAAPIEAPRVNERNVMSVALIGRKAGMTRIFTDAGETVPVTVIEVLPNRITQVKSVDKDGYRAIQVSFGKKRPQLLSKAAAGHYAKRMSSRQVRWWNSASRKKRAPTRRR